MRGNPTLCPRREPGPSAVCPTLLVIICQPWKKKNFHFTAALRPIIEGVRTQEELDEVLDELQEWKSVPRHSIIWLELLTCLEQAITN